jgi:RNA polymerase sigma factor (sigma-70 family)
MAVVISDRLLESSDRLLDAEPDAHLVRLVQNGHEAAFAAIVRRYERELQAQARRLTSDGRGEDAVQQAFLNAFTALQRGSEVRHLRGWLHQILRHEVTRARLPIDAPLDAAVAYGEPLEDTVQLRATARATLAELSSLPDRQRDALLSTAVFGLPRAHVARTMGLSEGAVRQLVHRARLHLRQAVTAVIPFPLLKLFGAARSGVDATPDAALGAGTAVSGGLVIKVGALLASGVVATGIAVTHTFPSRHPAAVPPHGTRHRPAHARVSRVGPAASVASTDAASVTNSVRLREHGPAATRADQVSRSGSGRLSDSRSGRHGGPGSGHGGAAGRGDDGSPGGRGDDGSGRSQGGTSGRGQQGAGSGSGSSSGSGSGSSDGGRGSGSGSSGSGSGSGHQGDSGSGSGSATGSSGSSGSGSGSGSDGASGSSDGGHGSGQSGSDGGNVSTTKGDASTASVSGSSGSSGPAPATATSDETSSDGGASSDGGSGDSENSSGSRDVSGSPHSSSS